MDEMREMRRAVGSETMGSAWCRVREQSAISTMQRLSLGNSNQEAFDEDWDEDCHGRDEHPQSSSLS